MSQAKLRFAEQLLKDYPLDERVKRAYLEAKQEVDLEESRSIQEHQASTLSTMGDFAKPWLEGLAPIAPFLAGGPVGLGLGTANALFGDPAGALTHKLLYGENRDQNPTAGQNLEGAGMGLALAVPHPAAKLLGLALGAKGIYDKTSAAQENLGQLGLPSDPLSGFGQAFLGGEERTAGLQGGNPAGVILDTHMLGRGVASEYPTRGLRKLFKGNQNPKLLNKIAAELPFVFGKDAFEIPRSRVTDVAEIPVDKTGILKDQKWSRESVPDEIKKAMADARAAGAAPFDRATRKSRVFIDVGYAKELWAANKPFEIKTEAGPQTINPSDYTRKEFFDYVKGHEITHVRAGKSEVVAQMGARQAGKGLNNLFSRPVLPKVESEWNAAWPKHEEFPPLKSYPPEDTPKPVSTQMSKERASEEIQAMINPPEQGKIFKPKPLPRETPIMDAVESAGGLRAKRGLKTNEYDDIPGRNPELSRVLGGNREPGQMVDHLISEGKLPPGANVADLWHEIHQELKAGMPSEEAPQGEPPEYINASKLDLGDRFSFQGNVHVVVRPTDDGFIVRDDKGEDIPIKRGETLPIDKDSFSKGDDDIPFMATERGKRKERISFGDIKRVGPPIEERGPMIPYPVVEVLPWLKRQDNSEELIRGAQNALKPTRWQQKILAAVENQPGKIPGQRTPGFIRSSGLKDSGPLVDIVRPGRESGARIANITSRTYNENALARAIPGSPDAVYRQSRLSSDKRFADEEFNDPSRLERTNVAQTGPRELPTDFRHRSLQLADDLPTYGEGRGRALDLAYRIAKNELKREPTAVEVRIRLDEIWAGRTDPDAAVVPGSENLPENVRGWNVSDAEIQRVLDYAKTSGREPRFMAVKRDAEEESPSGWGSSFRTIYQNLIKHLEEKDPNTKFVASARHKGDYKPGDFVEKTFGEVKNELVQSLGEAHQREGAILDAQRSGDYEAAYARLSNLPETHPIRTRGPEIAKAIRNGKPTGLTSQELADMKATMAYQEKLYDMSEKSGDTKIAAKEEVYFKQKMGKIPVELPTSIEARRVIAETITNKENYDPFASGEDYIANKYRDTIDKIEDWQSKAIAELTRLNTDAASIIPEIVKNAIKNQVYREGNAKKGLEELIQGWTVGRVLKNGYGSQQEGDWVKLLDVKNQEYAKTFSQFPVARWALENIVHGKLKLPAELQASVEGDLKGYFRGGGQRATEPGFLGEWITKLTGTKIDSPSEAIQYGISYVMKNVIATPKFILGLNAWDPLTRAAAAARDLDQFKIAAGIMKEYALESFSYFMGRGKGKLQSIGAENIKTPGYKSNTHLFTESDTGILPGYAKAILGAKGYVKLGEIMNKPSEWVEEQETANNRMIFLTQLEWILRDAGIKPREGDFAVKHLESVAKEKLVKYTRQAMAQTMEITGRTHGVFGKTAVASKMKNDQAFGRDSEDHLMFMLGRMFMNYPLSQATNIMKTFNKISKDRGKMAALQPIALLMATGMGTFGLQKYLYNVYKEKKDPEADAVRQGLFRELAGPTNVFALQALQDVGEALTLQKRGLKNIIPMVVPGAQIGKQIWNVIGGEK